MLLKALENRLITDMSKVVLANDIDKMMCAFNKMEQVRSNAEDHMFHDYPELSNDYIHVFYGNSSSDLNSSVNDEIKRIAKEIADGLIR